MGSLQSKERRPEVSCEGIIDLIYEIEERDIFSEQTFEELSGESSDVEYESSYDEEDENSEEEDEVSCDGIIDLIYEIEERDIFSEQTFEELSDESSDVEYESSYDEEDENSEEEDENIVLYHYTTDKGAQGISNDKVIKASTDTNNDAVFGEGVYLTAMDPYNYSKEDIIHNNYDDGILVHKSPRFCDKADSVIAVSIPASEVYKVDTDRDVYVYNGDLYLDEYDHAVIEN